MISLAYAWAYTTAIKYEEGEKIADRFHPDFFFATGCLDVFIVVVAAIALG